MKRTMDLVGGMMALILLFTLALVTAILLKRLVRPGHFRQERVGLHSCV